METLGQADVGAGQARLAGIDMEHARAAGRAMALYIPGLIVVVFILLFASQAGKPLHLDNMDFPAVASQTAATGVPIYYRGEERPRWSGLYHPPLYIYLLAGWIRLFGSGEAAVRLFGMVCALLQGGVVLALMRTLFGTALAVQWAPWFWALFLLNPYTLQSASITDIDTTIYGPLLCLALLAALRLSWRNGEWRTDPIELREFGWVSLAVFLCLWAKLTTVWLLFPFLFLLWIARFGMWRAALATACVAAASIAAFAASYFLYGALAHVDVSYTFAFTWESFVRRGSSGAAGWAARVRDQWKNLKFMWPFMLSWTGLLPWAASAAALCFTVNGAVRRRDRRLLHYGLILALAILTTWYYCAKVITFGWSPYKYSFVFWGLILTAPLFVIAGCSAGGWTHRLAIACAILYGASAIWTAVSPGDTLMLDGFKGPCRWIAYLPGLWFLAGLPRTRYRRVLLATGLCAYSGIQLGVASRQVKAPYATTYDYGQTGFTDTVAFIRTHTGPGDAIVSMKDIGYRSGRRYFESYDALYKDQASANRLMDAMASGKAAYIVFTEGRGQDQLTSNPALRQWVLEQCRLVQSYGNYRIYRLARPVP